MGSKTSTPQVATTPDEKKTLLPASQTTTDVKPSNEHQKEGTVTKENGEEPWNNPQQTDASVKENVQEPDLLPASETTTDVNPSNEHQKEGTVTKENGEEPGNNPQQAVASVKENVQEPEEIGVLHSQLATSLDNTLASGELANIIASSASPTRSAVEPACQDGTSMQTASGFDASMSPTTVEEITPPALAADSPRKDAKCGFCCW